MTSAHDFAQDILKNECPRMKGKLHTGENVYYSVLELHCRFIHFIWIYNEKGVAIPIRWEVIHNDDEPKWVAMFGEWD